MVAHPLDRLFDPDSVAVVGASTDSDTITGRPQRFLDRHGFDGDVYPVNPNHDAIDGLPCYDSVLDVPGPVDVAMVLVPASVVPSVLAECGEKGVEFAVVASSGFGEVGDEGRRRESRLRELAADAGVRVLGPNCQGVLNLHERLTLSFSSMLDRDGLLAGPLGFVTQSGAFGGAIFQMTQDMGIGTKYWASTGNEVDVDAVEVIDHLVGNPDVEVVVAYVESLKRGEAFARVARDALAAGTPILALKVGRSERGDRAATSHTGKMTGDYGVYRAIFDEYGVLSLDSIGAFRDAVDVFVTVADADVPSGEGNVGVITASGGAGVLIADACAAEGVVMADLADGTRAEIASIIPPYGSTINPVDVTGNTISSPDLFTDCIDVVLDDPGVESVILQFGNSGDEMGAAYRKEIEAVAAAHDKLVVAVFTGGRPPADVLDAYRDAGIPTFEDPVRAVRAIALLSRFAAARADHAGREPDGSDRIGDDRDRDRDRNQDQDQDRDRDRDPARTATRGGRERRPVPAIETWDDVRALTAEFDVPVARGRLAADPDAAVAVAEDLGYPVVVKAAAGDLDHRTDVGAVRTDLHTPDAVRAAFDSVVAAVREHAGDGRDDADGATRGVLVQEQCDDGVETIVGVLPNTDFGPVMMFGAGGVHAETLRDVSYRSLPLTRRTAADLVDATDVGRVLRSGRDRAYDVDALVDLLLGTAALYEAHDGIAELEMNPVVVGPDGATAVDFLLTRE